MSTTAENTTPKLLDLVPALPFILESEVASTEGLWYFYEGPVLKEGSGEKLHLFRHRENLKYLITPHTHYGALGAWRRKLAPGEREAIDRACLQTKILEWYELEPHTRNQLRFAAFLRKKATHTLAVWGPEAPTPDLYPELAVVLHDIPQLKLIAGELECIPGWKDHIEPLLKA